MRLSPSERPKLAGPASPLQSKGFAHRGLHGRGVPENSRAAIMAAVAERFGVEIDVRVSRDGRAFVFHDAMLERMTGVSGPVADRLGAELSRTKLLRSVETIPTLAEALALVAGRVPLLLELKTPDRNVGALCLAVRNELARYRGPVGLMSFNPEVGRWLQAHAPQLTRGLVLTETRKDWRGKLERWLSVRRARPHFLAYDVRCLPSPLPARMRAKGVPVFAWTVRTAAERARAENHADAPVFER